MKMKRFVILASLALIFALPISAKSVKDMWISMPDSFIGYLTENQRLELVEFVNMGLESSLKNSLGGTTRMDTLTANYLKVNLSEASTLEMKMLPTNGDSILCMVRTFSGPEKESEVSFFHQDWSSAEVNYKVPALIAKPDTMSETRFEELKKMIEPMMTYAQLSPSDNKITYALSLPLVNQEDKKTLITILVQKSLNWNTGTFNEY